MGVPSYRIIQQTTYGWETFTASATEFPNTGMGFQEATDRCRELNNDHSRSVFAVLKDWK